jgi:branched-chain amino acid transport system permease protein
VAAAVVVALCVPLFIHSPYYLDLAIMIMVNAVLAMTFIVTLRAGLINLGLVSFWGIGAYASAALTLKLGLSFWLALPLSTAITALIALLLGFVLIGSGSSGFTFVILSAVVGMIFSTLVGAISWLGGYNGLSNVPPPGALHLGFGTVDFTASKVPFFYLGLVLMLVVMLAFRALYSCWTGRAWTSIGHNPRLAESIGVNLFRYKLLAFVVSSAAAGLVGAFYANYEGFVTPVTFSMWQNIYVQCYAILGGLMFPLLGPIVGAGIMTMIPEVLRAASLWASVITGAILVVLILFFPYGFLGLVRDPLTTLHRALQPITDLREGATPYFLPRFLRRRPASAPNGNSSAAPRTGDDA